MLNHFEEGTYVSMSNGIYWHLTSWSFKIIPLGSALQSSKQQNIIFFVIPIENSMVVPLSIFKYIISSFLSKIK